jgi:hypothetical protein
MIDQIHQAESAIKAGDTRTAFEILRQVLADNPDSERAWWVMSGLVPREQRAHCLEQVLRVNPNNQFAQETLTSLEVSTEEPSEIPEPIQTSPPKESPPAETPKPVPDQKADDFQAWYYKSRSEVHITILANQGVIQAITEPGLVTRVQAAVSKGKLPDTLVKEKNPIPYQRLTRIRQIMSSLRLYFQKGKGEDSVRLELADTEAAGQVLTALREKLGPDFILNSQPMKLSSALMISILLLLGSLGITAFFLWGAIEVQSGRAGATGSIRTRSIINLLELLGPIGVGIIGGILILIAVGISTWVLFKPPTVTELVRRT